MVLARKNYQLGNIYLEEKDVKTAFSLYWEGLRTSPSPENLKMFLGIVFKKGLRLLTGDRLRQEALDRFGKQKIGRYSQMKLRPRKSNLLHILLRILSALACIGAIALKVIGITSWTGLSAPTLWSI